jgi:hypothetical protein
MIKFNRVVTLGEEHEKQQCTKKSVPQLKLGKGGRRRKEAQKQFHS